MSIDKDNHWLTAMFALFVALFICIGYMCTMTYLNNKEIDRQLQKQQHLLQRVYTVQDGTLTEGEE